MQSGSSSHNKSNRPTRRLEPAWIPVIENLESRRLLAVDTVQTLPFELDFSSSVADSLADKDGQGTGLTRVQANRLGNEYQPGLIDINPLAGVLRLATTGTSSASENAIIYKPFNFFNSPFFP